MAPIPRPQKPKRAGGKLARPARPDRKSAKVIGTKASAKVFRGKGTKEIVSRAAKEEPASDVGRRPKKEIISKDAGRVSKDTGRAFKKDDSRASRDAGRTSKDTERPTRDSALRRSGKPPSRDAAKTGRPTKEIGSKRTGPTRSRDTDADRGPAKEIVSRRTGPTPSREITSKGGTGRPEARKFGPPANRESTYEKPKKAFSSRTEAPGEPPETDEPELMYGKQAVLTALQNNRAFNRIWLIERLRYDPRFLRLIDAAKSSGAVIDIVEPRRLDQITDNGNHQGVAAQSAAHPYTELEDLLILAEGKPNPAFLAADGIEDPHNLGALIRSAEALGFLGVLIPRRRAVGVTATVAKVAAGAVEHLPIARVTNLNQALERLKEGGFRVVGAQEQSSKPLYEADLAGPLVVVIGSEGKGISLLTQRHCDQMVSIPLSGKTTSLNASVAGGIVLYEVVRQRLGKQIDMS